MSTMEEAAINLPQDDVSLYRRLKRRVFLLRSPWIDYVLYLLLMAGIIYLVLEGSSRVSPSFIWLRAKEVRKSPTTKEADEP